MQMTLTTFFVAIGAAMVSFASVSSEGQATDAFRGDPVTGKKVYEAYFCYACHGFTGETGARVLLPGRSASLGDEATFIAFLRGRANLAPTQPSTSMPNYAETTLTDAQARDMYAYVRTFKSSPPEVSDIEVFTQIIEAARKPYAP